MRLIDADALKENAFFHEIDDVSYVEEEDIDNAPTVDAVQVVYCKDCEYFKEIDQCFGECLHLPNGLVNDLYWFCADGERKDE